MGDRGVRHVVPDYELDRHVTALDRASRPRHHHLEAELIKVPDNNRFHSDCWLA